MHSGIRRVITLFPDSLRATVACFVFSCAQLFPVSFHRLAGPWTVFLLCSSRLDSSQVHDSIVAWRTPSSLHHRSWTSTPLVLFATKPGGTAADMSVSVAVPSGVTT